MHKIFPISNGNLDALWPQWRPLVEMALRGIDTHIPEDILDAVRSGNAHLWVQWSDRLEAFVVTEFAQYPRGRWLRLWLAAAVSEKKLDDRGFEDILSQWRDANECRGFEIIGRLGWLRRFSDARFIGAIMRSVS